MMIVSLRRLWRFAPLLALASCVAPAPQAPAPTPPAAAPAPPPPVVAEDWRDIPLTPGSWAYQIDAAGSSAMFGRAGAEADLIIRCERGSRTLVFSRAGVTASAQPSLGIVTSAGSQSYAASETGGTPPRLTASARANDPFLDKIAFSRGRFLVAAAGTPRLVLPAWAEVARTIEDCRK